MRRLTQSVDVRHRKSPLHTPPAPTTWLPTGGCRGKVHPTMHAAENGGNDPTLKTAAGWPHRHRSARSRSASSGGSPQLGETPAPRVVYLRSSSIACRRYADRSEPDAEFYEYSTLHGISDIYRSRNGCMRAMWLIIFLGAVVASFYCCGGIIKEYLEKPVVVSYFVQEPENNTLEVPDIVVCPFNRFNRSFFVELNISDGLAQYLELSFPSPPIHEFQKKLLNQAILKVDQHDVELYQMLAKLGNISYSEFLERASLHCSAFILEPLNCSQMATVMTSAGKCVRVPGKTQSGAGYGYGRRVVMRLPHTLFNPGINQLLNNGIAVKLAARDKGLNHDLMFVPGGSHAILPLKATRYMFMNDPPRYTCEKNLQLHYSRQMCFDSCLIEKAEMDCRCRLPPSGNRQPSLPTCTTLLFFGCFYPKFFSSQTNQETTCRLRCLPPCEYWEYRGSMSYAKFPSPEARAFITNASELEALEQTIILNVFFEQLEYTLIKHVVAMTPVSFIAQLGGQISLFVGGSIMTIFQVIIYGAQSFWRLRKCRCGGSRRRPDSESTATGKAAARCGDLPASILRRRYANTLSTARDDGGGRSWDTTMTAPVSGSWNSSAPHNSRRRQSSSTIGGWFRWLGGERQASATNTNVDGDGFEDVDYYGFDSNGGGGSVVTPEKKTQFSFCRNSYANGGGSRLPHAVVPTGLGHAAAVSFSPLTSSAVGNREASLSLAGFPPYFTPAYAGACLTDGGSHEDARLVDVQSV